MTDDGTFDLQIETRDLSKTFGGPGEPVHAVRNGNFMARRGEFLAIMGPSGCGKSTLLHLLSLLDRPTSGEIRLGGARIDELNEHDAAILRRQRIGVVFQFFNLLPNLTVAANVELPALLAGRSSTEARERSEALLERLGLVDKARRFPSQLSGGQQQRVAVARATINEPEVLLADEPTGNLDSLAAGEVMALFGQLHERGQTIVLVTHDDQVAAGADMVLRMRDGQLGETAPPPRGPARRAE
jgi:putative ABC transport system ATP-binding protein